MRVHWTRVFLVENKTNTTFGNRFVGITTKQRYPFVSRWNGSGNVAKECGALERLRDRLDCAQTLSGATRESLVKNALAKPAEDAFWFMSQGYTYGLKWRKSKHPAAITKTAEKYTRTRRIYFYFFPFIFSYVCYVSKEGRVVARYAARARCVGTTIVRLRHKDGPCAHARRSMEIANGSHDNTLRDRTSNVRCSERHRYQMLNHGRFFRAFIDWENRRPCSGNRRWKRTATRSICIYIYTYIYI